MALNMQHLFPLQQKFTMTKMKTYKSVLLGVSASLVISVNTLFGGAVVAGFDATALAANDDGSTGLVGFGLGPLNFFGTDYTGAYLNNNGNMTFAGPLSTFTPFGITGGSLAMIAPFFADVDTRGAGSGVMKYGAGTFEGHAAFGQTWRDVGYFASNVNKLNTFQTLLVNRSDIAAKDFDIYFNYDTIKWETGGASGGSNGLGGSSARAGYTNGLGSFYELPGSGVNGAFLDGGVNALNTHSLNRTEAGRYLFMVRSGVVHGAPDGGSVIALLGLALAALGAAKRKLG